jgi:hypothetical protein
MPWIDIIMERLKAYDEVEVCDLLCISTEDLLERFRDRVVARKQHLESELEIMYEDQFISGDSDPADLAEFESEDDYYQDLEDEDS